MMRPDASTAAVKKNATLTPRDARESELLILVCGDMFASGFDTRDMAIRLVIPECAAAAALHIARERQRLGV